MATSRSLFASPTARGLLALLTLISLTSCSGPEPTQPSRATLSNGTASEASGFGSASFYPLQIGNAWNYEGGGSFRDITDGPPGDPLFTYAFTESHRLIGATSYEGASYVVEEQVHHEVPEDEGGPFIYWSRFRQDAAGLFVLDTLLTSPPSVGANAERAGLSTVSRIERAALASGHPANPALQRLARRLDALKEAIRVGGRSNASGPSGLELTELVYPLRVGQSWSIRPDFPWPARVDRVEGLDTPACRITAYRIELDPFGTTVKEGEWVRVWWSRQGYLGYSIHFVDEETDADGQPTGKVYVSDEAMTVTGINLVK
ncbi:MAG TPA: hypothetical protein VJX91_01110 [Candidatus Eisenbacteria bacterium]|nr:hypothetical protein [Candidatus Eisenbacteria bacterium]